MFKEKFPIYLKQAVDVDWENHWEDLGKFTTAEQLTELKAEIQNQTPKEEEDGLKSLERTMFSWELDRLEQSENLEKGKLDLIALRNPATAPGYLDKVLNYLAALSPDYLFKNGFRFFPDLIKYSNIETLELIDIFIAKGFASEIWYWRERFGEEFQVALADKLIESGYIPVNLINCPGYDLKKAVHFICQSGQIGQMLASYVNHEKAQLIYQYTIEEGYGEWVTTAIRESFIFGVRPKNHKGVVDERLLIDQLIGAKNFKNLAENAEFFRYKSHITDQLFKYHQEEVLTLNLENFDISNYQETALKIISAGKGYLVADYLEKFKNVNHYKIAMAIIEGNSPNQGKNLESLKLVFPELELRSSEREELIRQLKLKGLKFLNETDLEQEDEEVSYEKNKGDAAQYQYQID